MKKIPSSFHRPLSRRAFMSGALAGAGLMLHAPSAGGQTCPVPNFSPAIANFTPDTALAIRERKRVSALSAAEVTRLRLAYQKCRDLSVSDPSDPRGFLQQAQIHHCYCGHSAEVHNTYFFLPWHRAFLYFHERILGKLIGDMSFALPCWDWDDANSQQLPSIYAQSAGNSLFDANRAVNVPLPMLVARAAAMTQSAMKAVTPDAFLGADWVPVHATAGNIETGAHNFIHSWVAGGAKADMGLQSTAARDPVFYAHHANVDRMWTKWLAQGGGRANHGLNDFLNETWEFFDENKNLVRIKSSDVLNHEAKLRYRYDVALPSPQPAAPKTTTLMIPVDTDPPPHSLPITPKTYTITPNLVEAAALVGATPALGFTVYLEMEGISIPADTAPFVNVFWGNTDATALTPETDPSFVGVISKFASDTATPNVERKFSVIFEVTERANAISPLAPSISITFVPTLAGLPPPTFQVAYDALRLRIMH